MAIGLVTAIRTNMLQQIIDAIDAGAGAGVIKIYNGTRPATGGAATTLLAELVCSNPAAASNTNGVLTLDAIADDTSANATGTASWFRVEDSNGTAVLDGDVGTSGSDLNLNTVAFTSGDVVSITSFVINANNA